MKPGRLRSRASTASLFRFHEKALELPAESGGFCVCSEGVSGEREGGDWCSNAERGEGGRPCECGRLVGGGTGREGLLARRTDKAGLCPWPLITGQACRGLAKGNIFQSVGKSADFPLKGSKGILKCRALEAARAGGAPCGFVAYLAVDHQMTPTLFAGLFGPAALPPRSLTDRLSGSASRPLRPKAPRAVP